MSTRVSWPSRCQETSQQSTNHHGSRMLTRVYLGFSSAATPIIFPPLNVTARRDALRLLKHKVGALRDLAPDMGAYVNEVSLVHYCVPVRFCGTSHGAEPHIRHARSAIVTDGVKADPEEPPQTFWGDHLPHLLEIKRTADPQDVLWCTPCVGDDRWEVVGNKLCRKSRSSPLVVQNL